MSIRSLAGCQITCEYKRYRKNEIRVEEDLINHCQFTRAQYEQLIYMNSKPNNSRDYTCLEMLPSEAKERYYWIKWQGYQSTTVPTYDQPNSIGWCERNQEPNRNMPLGEIFSFLFIVLPAIVNIYIPNTRISHIVIMPNGWAQPPLSCLFGPQSPVLCLFEGSEYSGVKH